MDETNEVIGELVLDGHVRDMLLRALIATHPDHKAVAAAFQVQLSDSEFALPDSGFAVGMPAEATRQMQEGIRARAEKWSKFWIPRSGG